MMFEVYFDERFIVEQDTEAEASAYVSENAMASEQERWSVRPEKPWKVVSTVRGYAKAPARTLDKYDTEAEAEAACAKLSQTNSKLQFSVVQS